MSWRDYFFLAAGYRGEAGDYEDHRGTACRRYPGGTLQAIERDLEPAFGRGWLR